MKKMILMAVITISTVAFAQVKEGKVANREQSREFLQKREDYKKYEKAVTDGNMTDAIRSTFKKFLNDSTSGLDAIKTDGLESLINMAIYSDSKLPTSEKFDAAAKVITLITLAKNGTVEQKAKATNDLKILADGAMLLDSSEATGLAEARALLQISEMADYNENAKNFKSELAKELRKSGISVSEAISKASKGKITLDKIKDCTI